MDVLERPVVRDQLASQPVEQLGMRRVLPHVAEVVGRRHDPASEIVLPDSVHDHARHNRRLLRIDHLQREFQSLGTYLAYKRAEARGLVKIKTDGQTDGDKT